jgi:hypothetical protein
MINKLNFRKIKLENNGKEVIFLSIADMEDYLVKNFSSIELKDSYTLKFWKRILTVKYGELDWEEGITNNGYDTTANGWYDSFAGSHIHECGIKVWGTPVTGDAYYGYDGSIKFSFPKTALGEK